MANTIKLLEALSAYTGDQVSLDRFAAVAKEELGDSWMNKVYQTLLDLTPPLKEKLDHAYRYYGAVLSWNEIQGYLASGAEFDETEVETRLETLSYWLSFFGSAGDDAVASLKQKIEEIKLQKEKEAEEKAQQPIQQVEEETPTVEEVVPPQMEQKELPFEEETIEELPTLFDEVEEDTSFEEEEPVPLVVAENENALDEEGAKTETPEEEVYEEDGTYQEGAEVYEEDGTYQEGEEVYEDDGTYQEGEEVYEDDGTYQEGEEVYEDDGTYQEGAEVYEDDGTYQEGAEVYEEDGTYQEGAEVYEEDGTYQEGAEVYEEDGTYQEGAEVYDENAYYDDGTYEDGTYDDGTYEDGTYEDAYLTDDNQTEGTYDDADIYDDLYDTEEDNQASDEDFWQTPVYVQQKAESNEEFMAKKVFHETDFLNAVRCWVNARCIALGNKEIYTYRHYGFLVDLMETTKKDMQEVLSDPTYYPALESVRKGGLKKLQSLMVSLENDLQIAYDNLPSELTALISDSVNSDDVRASLGRLDTSNKPELLGVAPDGFEMVEDPFEGLSLEPKKPLKTEKEKTTTKKKTGLSFNKKNAS